MSVSLRVLTDHLGVYAAGLRAEADKAVRATALAVEADWKAGVRVDTGRLRASIGTIAQAPGRVEVGTNLEYAPFENYGTRRMAGSFAREKAVEKNRAAHAAAVREALRAGE